MKISFFPLLLSLIGLATLPGITGCGGGQEEQTPQQTDTLRQQHLQHAERERQEG